jgi:malate dehydrogenase (quinone)
MLEVLQRCWPERFGSSAWQEQLRALIPAWGIDLAQDPDRLRAMRAHTDAALGLAAA